MFEVGALVIYGSGGVFRIDGIREEKFGNEKKKYYVMSTTAGAEKGSTHLMKMR